MLQSQLFQLLHIPSVRTTSEKIDFPQQGLEEEKKSKKAFSQRNYVWTSNHFFWILSGLFFFCLSIALSLLLQGVGSGVSFVVWNKILLHSVKYDQWFPLSAAKPNLVRSYKSFLWKQIKLKHQIRCCVIFNVQNVKFNHVLKSFFRFSS